MGGRTSMVTVVAVLAVAVAMGAVIQGSIGFGYALVAVPAMVLLLPWAVPVRGGGRPARRATNALKQRAPPARAPGTRRRAGRQGRRSPGQRGAISRHAPPASRGCRACREPRSPPGPDRLRRLHLRGAPGPGRGAGGRLPAPPSATGLAPPLVLPQPRRARRGHRAGVLRARFPRRPPGDPGGR